MFVIQILGDALHGRPPPRPTYVLDCDFGAPPGRDGILLTQKREDAKQFVTSIEALEFWRTRSKTDPTRPDGKPNRPLTMYSVTLLSEDQEPQ